MHAARKLLSLTPIAILFLAVRPDASSLTPPPGRMRLLPSRILWVWERPEDLRSVDPGTTAIATLDRTILLGRTAQAIPRRQTVAIPAGIVRIGVVRIEAPGDIAPDLVPLTEALVLQSVSKPKGHPQIAALQIDFDARRSQRAFYARLLRALRRDMPPDMPLSITALASWCSAGSSEFASDSYDSDGWIATLPIDEAVPMYFRMEPDRRDAPLSLPQFRIRQPLCMNSIGISTREVRRVELTGKRVYIFPDRGWRQDLPLITPTNLAQRNQP